MEFLRFYPVLWEWDLTVRILKGDHRLVQKLIQIQCSLCLPKVPSSSISLRFQPLNCFVLISIHRDQAQIVTINYFPFLSTSKSPFAPLNSNLKLGDLSVLGRTLLALI